MFGSIWGLMAAILGFKLNSVNSVNSVELVELAESTHAFEKNETLTKTGIYEHLCLKMTADKGVSVSAQCAFDNGKDLAPHGTRLRTSSRQKHTTVRNVYAD
jgi:hypothetical protein